MGQNEQGEVNSYRAGRLEAGTGEDGKEWDVTRKGTCRSGAATGDGKAGQDLNGQVGVGRKGSGTIGRAGRGETGLDG